MRIAAILTFLLGLPAALAITGLPVGLPVDQGIETFSGFISNGNITVEGSINIKSTTDMHFRTELNFHENNDGVTFQVYTELEAQKCDMRNLAVTIGANLIVPNPADGLASDALCLAQNIFSNEELKEMCDLLEDPTITLPVLAHTESVTPHLDENGSFDWCDNLHDVVRSSGAAVGLQATDDWVDATGTDFDFCFHDVRPLFTGLLFNLTVSGFAFDLDQALLCDYSYTCEEDTNFLGPCIGDCPVSNIESLQDCQALCDATDGCNAVVHNKYGDCYLKATKGVAAPDMGQHDTTGCSKVGGPHYNPHVCTVMRHLLRSINGGGAPLFDVNDLNVGKLVYKSVGEQPWVQSDGMFVIGGNSSTPFCQIREDPFQLTMDLTDHYNLARDLADPDKRQQYLDAVRKGLVDAVNECLPEGYSIREDALSNLTLAFSNVTSKAVVSGLMGAGGGKNPAGLLRCIQTAQNIVVANVSTHIASLVYQEGEGETQLAETQTTEAQLTDTQTTEAPATEASTDAGNDGAGSTNAGNDGAGSTNAGNDGAGGTDVTTTEIATDAATRAFVFSNGNLSTALWFFYCCAVGWIYG